MYFCIYPLQGNAAYLAQACNNQTDPVDGREGLERERLDGKGSERQKFEREGVKKLFIVLA
jgi:hypothetical protein